MMDLDDDECTPATDGTMDDIPTAGTMPTATEGTVTNMAAMPPDRCGPATTEFNLNRKIFVDNISYRVGSRKLSRFFRKFGPVEYCYIVKDHLKRWSKGMAFITFKTEESMRNALQASGDQLIIDQRQMRVQPAEISHKATYWQSPPGGREMEGVEEDWGVDQANPNEAGVYLEQTTTTDPHPAAVSTRNGDQYSTRTNIDALFDELLLGIFSRLTMRERIGVERVCRRWQRLVQQSWITQRHLHFQGCFRRFDGLTDRTLNSVLSKCGQYLHSLDLSASPRLLTDFAMDIIGKHCPDIEKLDLSNVKVTNISMRNLVKKCTKLQWVRLRSCIYLQDKGIQDLLGGSPDLLYLDVTDMFNLTGQCFKGLGEKTETVLAVNCHQLQDRGLQHLARQAPGLLELNMNQCCQLSDVAIHTTCQNFTHLKRLNISGTLSKVTSGALCNIQQLGHLEELVASFNPAVTDPVLIAVAGACTNLRQLDISGCYQGVSDVGVAALRNLRALHTLNLSYLSKVSEVSMLTLSHSLNVKKMVARATKFITDEAVISLVSSWPDLDHLDVSGCFQVTNAIFQAFNDSPVDANRPVYLFLGGTSVDWVSEDIDWVTGFSHLNVSMHNLAMEQLRPDRDIILPADDDDYEEEQEYGDHPPLSNFEVDAVDESYDWQDTDYDEYLDNDDPLEEERWELS